MHHEEQCQQLPSPVSHGEANPTTRSLHQPRVPKAALLPPSILLAVSVQLCSKSVKFFNFQFLARELVFGFREHAEDGLVGCSLANT